MASGGSGSSNGSSFNPFKKKGRLLTPKLLRKRETTTKDKAAEKDTEVPTEAVSPAPSPVSPDDRPVVPGPSCGGPTPGDSPSAAAPPCDRPECTSCPNSSSSTSNSRLSTSTENLGPNINKTIMKRKSKTLTLKRRKTETSKNNGKIGSRFWTFRIKKRAPVKTKDRCKEAAESGTSCVCTGYRRTEESQPTSSVRFAPPGNSLLGASASPIQPNSTRTARLALGAGPGPTGVRRFSPQLFQLVPAPQQTTAVIDMARTNPDDYPTEDIDEMMIAQRARDMELGIEISPSHFAYPHLRYSSSVSSSSSSSGSSTISEQTSLNLAFQNQCVVTTTTLYPGASGDSMISRESFRSRESEYGEFGTLSAPSSAAPGSYIPRTVHTQVDYIHCLVPDLTEITKCSFYWGVIDRYEAERLLENRPEGSFLLRDSAQEEFLFSVSFRRYGRSLHARIEQWNHKFSFDSHDPGVFASDTVCGLIEHYKDPSCCMFFEPMLTNPLNRTFPFSLQHLCRTIICSNTTYDGLNFLPLPKSLRDYLKYYHYKQKVRVRRFEVHH